MILKYINELDKPWNILAWIGIVVFVLLMVVLLTRLNKLIFKRIQKKNDGLHLLFLQHLISVFIVVGSIVLVVSSFAGIKSVWTTIFGGTAIVSAVVAFAAQDVIKDVLAGLMLSIHRPFEVGDRISLQDGTAGIVEEMTLRHVVLIGVESLRYVVPNSVINAMRLNNYSFKNTIRSVVFQFPVAYTSDLEFVKKVISQAVEDSEYTTAGYVDRHGDKRYGSVLFMSINERAFVMQVTAYYEPVVNTETVIDDVNTRVRNALRANGIEIPHNYVNVVESEDRQLLPPQAVVDDPDTARAAMNVPIANEGEVANAPAADEVASSEKESTQDE